jgi:cobalt-precorrin 5A hydrolase
VVCDEAGQFAISLVSGHVGGANALACEVARATGGQPVITTATDVNRVPAIDLIAVENRAVHRESRCHQSSQHGPAHRQTDLHARPLCEGGHRLPKEQIIPSAVDTFGQSDAGIFVDHLRLDLPPHVLVLRPGSLVAGMGCNRGTDVKEMRDLLVETFAANRLAIASLRALATVDLKADEPGLLALAESLKLSLTVFTRDRLKGVAQVPTPSTMVEKHIGVKSVCEAAASAGDRPGATDRSQTEDGQRHRGGGRRRCISSASDPADRRI